MDTFDTTHQPAAVLPDPVRIDAARARILSSLPDAGLGDAWTEHHLEKEITEGLNASSRSANYYGFVTGGATPAAILADSLVTRYDQNVQVHLPSETIATDVEHRAATMVCELLDLDPKDWPHRTFTTGATAANILGLASAREHVVSAFGQPADPSNMSSVAASGIHNAMQTQGLEAIQILTTVPHSSLRKAASIVGLGRDSLAPNVSQDANPHLFDLTRLEHHLSRPSIASIVVISCSEVNTGLFATTHATIRSIRALCTQHSAWLHIDAAFGLLARVLPSQDPSYTTLLSGVSCLDHADSIAADAHKLLNVPYDCGIYLSRHLDTGTTVFQNPNAAYLTSPSPSAPSGTTAAADAIPSPLNIRIENSARFRALPVYATLAAYGRRGYREMLERQVGLARAIAGYVLDSEGLELLPRSARGRRERLEEVYIIVLFRATDDGVNGELVKRINGTRRIYVSGTTWEGKPATRFAVSNWQVNVARDMKLIREVLEGVLQHA